MSLTSSECHFLSIIVDGGTIACGSSVGLELYQRGSSRSCGNTAIRLRKPELLRLAA
jgi:hypothetical protein